MSTLLCIAGMKLSADGAHGNSDKARSQAQRLGRPPSSKGSMLQASTWFDEVAAPRMQQMCIVQKNAVKVYDQALDQQVQDLTVSLAQASAFASWPAASNESNRLVSHASTAVLSQQGHSILHDGFCSVVCVQAHLSWKRVWLQVCCLGGSSCSSEYTLCHLVLLYVGAPISSKKL